MKLTALERIVCLQLFPQKGASLAKARIFRADKDKLGLTEEELKKYSKDNGTFTDLGMKEEVEIEVSATTQKELKSELEKLVSGKNVEDRHINLCDKFEVSDPNEKKE